MNTTKLERWLGVLIQHKAVDEGRRRRCRPQSSLDAICGDGSVDLSELGRKDDHDKAEFAEAMEAARVLLPHWQRQFIATLPEGLREIATLSLAEGLKAPEIRERLMQAGADVPGLRMVQYTVQKKIIEPFIEYAKRALEVES